MVDTSLSTVDGPVLRLHDSFQARLRPDIARLYVSCILLLCVNLIGSVKLTKALYYQLVVQCLSRRLQLFGHGTYGTAGTITITLNFRPSEAAEMIR